MPGPVVERSRHNYSENPRPTKQGGPAVSTSHPYSASTVIWDPRDRWWQSWRRKGEEDAEQWCGQLRGDRLARSPAGSDRAESQVIAGSSGTLSDTLPLGVVSPLHCGPPRCRVHLAPDDPRPDSGPPTRPKYEHNNVIGTPRSPGARHLRHSPTFISSELDRRHERGPLFDLHVCARSAR